jgi:hypothetical protein
LRFVGTGMDEFRDDPGNETDDDGPKDVPHGGRPVLRCRFSRIDPMQKKIRLQPLPVTSGRGVSCQK